MRGFFAVGAEGISKPMNLGNLVRSAHAFGASFVFLVNADYAVRSARSDTSQAEHQLPVYDFASPEELLLPRGCRLVGCELVDEAVDLPSFRHPHNAAYVFGPERSSLSPAMLARCHHVVRIPTRFCINLAVAGAVVMYDRLPVPRAGSPPGRCMSAGRPSRCLRMFTARSAGTRAVRLPRARCRERSVRSFNWHERAIMVRRVPPWIEMARGPMRDRLRWVVILLTLAAMPPIDAKAQTAAAAPRQISAHRDWSVYEVTDNRGRICYIASEPTAQSGNYSRRDPPAVLVARLPGSPPSEEVSVQPGYSYLKSSSVDVKVDGRPFKLFTDGRACLDPYQRGGPVADRGDEGRRQHDRTRHLGPQHLLAGHLLAGRFHRRLRGDAGCLQRMSLDAEALAADGSEPDRARPRRSPRAAGAAGSARAACGLRARQLFHWLYHRGAASFAAMSTLPRELRSQLEAGFSAARPAIAAEQRSSDGTRKWLMRFADGQEVETVFIPEDDRGALCVSTQVGCTLTCSFCHTGTMPLVRNLSPPEIVAQILVARDQLEEWPTGREGRLFTNIVMMGMGEPLFNYDATVAALRLAMDEQGLNLSRRRITVSTSGVVPRIGQLGADLGVGLAISLHAVRDELRDELVPINRKWNIAALLDACRNYPTRRPITFEYVMLHGVNDSDGDARELVRLLRDVPAKVNLIPFNPWPGSAYTCSSNNRIHAFAAIVEEAGYASPVRTPRGRDILAACGQLRTDSRRRRAALPNAA